ncbi:MAG: DUF72 domain-containing protein [Deltaproteobacteria bacterium]|nr:DUF72 domain-containing protein [Deltaproteobacteria bacterium]MBW2305968.1 DUF72 domain-containing protein [Deltaproteobacteria bacterium]
MSQDTSPSRGEAILSNDELEQIHIGPAGWSYADWKERVYPSTPGRGFHPLTYLSRYFSTVEVNSSFYRPPALSHCREWCRRVAHDHRFRFTIKLWRGFTHERETDIDETVVGIYRDAIDVLQEHGKLGCLLLQFPWSFKNLVNERQRLAELLDRFGGYPLVVEVRHSSWNTPAFYRFLSRREIGFVNIDQPLFVRSMGPSARVTWRVAYIRLHGRNYADWFRNGAGRDERYDYLYSMDELQEWARRVALVVKSAREVYVITNNHFRGQAICNAHQLQFLLSGRPIRIAETVLKTFPHLNEIAC